MIRFGDFIVNPQLRPIYSNYAGCEHVLRLLLHIPLILLVDPPFSSSSSFYCSCLPDAVPSLDIAHVSAHSYYLFPSSINPLQLPDLQVEYHPPGLTLLLPYAMTGLR